MVDTMSYAQWLGHVASGGKVGDLYGKSGCDEYHCESLIESVWEIADQMDVGDTPPSISVMVRRSVTEKWKEAAAIEAFHYLVDMYRDEFGLQEAPPIYSDVENALQLAVELLCKKLVPWECEEICRVAFTPDEWRSAC